MNRINNVPFRLNPPQNSSTSLLWAPQIILENNLLFLKIISCENS